MKEIKINSRQVAIYILGDNGHGLKMICDLTHHNFNMWKQLMVGDYHAATLMKEEVSKINAKLNPNMDPFLVVFDTSPLVSVKSDRGVADLWNDNGISKMYEGSGFGFKETYQKVETILSSEGHLEIRK